MKGYLNWIHIPGTESSYLLTIEDDKIDYNFAISENWEFLDPSKQITTRSSGMFFESCSILSNQFSMEFINKYIYYTLMIYIDYLYTYL